MRRTGGASNKKIGAEAPISLTCLLYERRSARPAATPAIAHDERDHGRDQEEPEQDLCDSRGGAGDAGEAEDRRNDRDDEESNRPAKHESLQRLIGQPSTEQTACRCCVAATYRERELAVVPA